MISEFKFKHLILDVRNKVMKKYPYLKETISQKDRKVKYGEYGMSLRITNNIFVNVNENHLYFFSFYGMDSRMEAAEDIISIFTESALSRNINGIIYSSLSEKHYPIGEKARDILSWKEKIPEMEIEFNGNIKFKIKVEQSPNYKFKFLLNEEKPVIIGYVNGYLSGDPIIEMMRFSSKEEIITYFQKMKNDDLLISQKTNELIRYLLDNYSGSVKQNENVPVYLKIFGENEFIYLSKRICLDTKKEVFTTHVKDNFLDHENIDELIKEATLLWSNYIKKNRVRKIVGVEK